MASPRAVIRIIGWVQRECNPSIQAANVAGRRVGFVDFGRPANGSDTFQEKQWVALTHGLASHPADWPYSTFQKTVGLGCMIWHGCHRITAIYHLAWENGAKDGGIRFAFPPYVCYVCYPSAMAVPFKRVARADWRVARRGSILILQYTPRRRIPLLRRPTWWPCPGGAKRFPGQLTRTGLLLV